MDWDTSSDTAAAVSEETLIARKASAQASAATKVLNDIGGVLSFVDGG